MISEKLVLGSGGGGEREGRVSTSSCLRRTLCTVVSPAMSANLARSAHEVFRIEAWGTRCGFFDRDDRRRRGRSLRAERDLDRQVGARRGAHRESDNSERPVTDRLEAFDRAKGDRCRLQRDVQLGKFWAKVQAAEALWGGVAVWKGERV